MAIVLQYMRTTSLPRFHRPLHVVDVDNLMGDPRVIDDVVLDRWLDEYRHVAGYRPGEHAVVGTGCNARHAFAVQRCWQPARIVRRPGPDGADEALIEAAVTEAERGRYSHFIIGSGDHRFADLHDTLVDRGYPVWVVSRPRALSHTLRQRAGDHVLYLPDTGLI